MCLLCAPCTVHSTLVRNYCAMCDVCVCIFIVLKFFIYTVCVCVCLCLSVQTCVHFKTIEKKRFFSPIFYGMQLLISYEVHRVYFSLPILRTVRIFLQCIFCFQWFCCRFGVVLSCRANIVCMRVCVCVGMIE